MTSLDAHDAVMNGVRALIVEDNPGDARLLQEIARDVGLSLEFKHADRVSSGLAALAAEHFDIIISDLGLPDSTGPATVEALRKAAPDCPIIVLTGSAAGIDDQGIDVLRAGADDYLVKGSIDANSLGRSIRYAIERRNASRRIEETLREEARIVGTLHRIGVTLASQLDLQTIVQRVTDEATEACRAQFGAFFYNVLDEQGEWFTLYTISGVPRSEFERFPMPRNTHVFGPTFRGEGVVRSDDITQDPRYGHNSPYHGMPPGHLPVRSYLAIPVQGRDGTTIGGLFFGHSEPAVFTERDEQVVSGIAGWAGLAMDNARLYEAEQKARGEAETANQAKANFLATMSHELRTPLNAMIGYTDLWLIGLPATLPEEIVPQVERLRSSAHHLLSLIEEILSFSRLEAAQETLELEDVDASELMHAVAGLIEPLALARGLRFETSEAAPGVPMWTDARKLRQILINLLSNAVKFTVEGEVRLDFSTVDDRARFVVRDTGPGIDPADHRRVFDPFWQARQSQADRAAGTGLGLAVSRRLARLMGGEIELQSTPGTGSAFIVDLPLRVSEPASAEEAVAAD